MTRLELRYSTTFLWLCSTRLAVAVPVPTSVVVALHRLHGGGAVQG